VSLLLGIVLYCLGALVVQWVLRRVVRLLGALGLWLGLLGAFWNFFSETR